MRNPYVMDSLCVVVCNACTDQNSLICVPACLSINMDPKRRWIGNTQSHNGLYLG